VIESLSKRHTVLCSEVFAVLRFDPILIYNTDPNLFFPSRITLCIQSLNFLDFSSRPESPCGHSFKVKDKTYDGVGIDPN
jgi:hypothetical protein